MGKIPKKYRFFLEDPPNLSWPLTGFFAITLDAVCNEVTEFMVGVFGGKEWASSPPSITSRKEEKSGLKPRETN